MNKIGRVMSVENKMNVSRGIIKIKQFLFNSTKVCSREQVSLSWIWSWVDIKVEIWTNR